MRPVLDDCHVQAAILIAQRSPCRSKRGVSLFDPSTGAYRGSGFNGPPPIGTPCPSRDVCAGTCGQRCVHAEMRALRAADWHRRRFGCVSLSDLVHVELAEDGSVVACAGPSCWQCSREILDVGFVGGVWLYELSGEQQSTAWSSSQGRWHRYTAEEFHRATLKCGGMVP